MKYAWTDAKKSLIKATVTEEKEETFSLEDPAQEWKNRKAALATAQADIVAFREKIMTLLAALTLKKTDLIGMPDLDTFEVAK